MAALTQIQYSEQMVSQIRLLKPSVSAEVGTPERLILDTAANALAQSTIDFIGLQNALNVDTKYGSNLTNFMNLFGFARTESTNATGFVVFSRNAPSNFNILVPSGTILKSNKTVDGLLPEFVTTAAVTLPAGQLETTAVPIRAIRPGSASNVPAETIKVSTLLPTLGITSVTNPVATTGGEDQENDNELKARFKNTVFRNLSGTEDQFLALAIATAFSTKAVVIGPVSKYQEYVQVPQKEIGSLEGDDTTEYPFGGNTPYSGTPAPFVVTGAAKVGSKIITTSTTRGMKAGEPLKLYEDGDNPGVAVASSIVKVVSETELEITVESKNEVIDGILLVGEEDKETLVNQWTTALSDNPFAKEIWIGLPVFISDQTSGISKFFFRENIDFTFNYPAKLQGDTLRALIDGTGLDPRTNLQGKNQPNITFTNVFLGSSEAIKAISPGDVVLLEYSYTSSSSRNSILHNVTNAVDVYVDGSNEQPTSTIFSAPLGGQTFVDDPMNMYYYENYRRDGEPSKRPLEGNTLTPLFNEPVLKIPNQIVIGASKYYLGVHYWLVHDTSGYAGTIRARDGIEWSATIKGDLGGEYEGVPTPENEEPEYKGKLFSEWPATTAVEVNEYFYDQNIEDLQAAYESARQVTTDTLAHRAHLRFFKLDITVIYSPQSTISAVNEAIRETVALFLANQYFGSVVRLSDLLNVIHNVNGVENVRWSNDVPNDKNLTRVLETDVNGRALRGVSFDRIHWGASAIAEIQALYIDGNVKEGQFAITSPTGKTSSFMDIATVTAAEIESAYNFAFETKVTVTEDQRSTTGVLQPIRSFRIVFETPGKRAFPLADYTIEAPLIGGEYTFDTDFFLRDDELPALPIGLQGEGAHPTFEEHDTVPGLIIRARAQNVWQKA